MHEEISIRYLSTMENHTPKANYRGGRPKSLQYHIGNPILTNMGQRHPILSWFLTIPYPQKADISAATLTYLHSATLDHNPPSIPHQNVNNRL